MNNEQLEDIRIWDTCNICRVWTFIRMFVTFGSIRRYIVMDRFRFIKKLLSKPPDIDKIMEKLKPYDVFEEIEKLGFVKRDRNGNFTIRIDE